MVESQEVQAGLVKSMHELRQFVITKLALCASRLDSLDGVMQNYRTEVAQTSTNWEALEKRVAMTEDILVHAGLREIKTEIQEVNEKMMTLQDNWEVATAKLQGFDSEVRVLSKLNCNRRYKSGKQDELIIGPSC